MSIEKYSCYEFEVKHELVPIWSQEGKTNKTVDGYTYEILGEGCKPYYDGIIKSEEWFDTEQEARFAAIGHIDLLENGEG
jgi:hypothetical protein